MSNRKIKERVSEFYGKVHEESFSETKDRKFWFLFFAGFVSVMFFLLFALIGKNPFSFLLPMSIYDNFLPVYDKRKTAKIFLSDGQKNAFLSERKVYLSGELHKDLKTLLIEISEPPYYGTEDSKSNREIHTNMKKLPGLHFALIQSWLLKDKTLILDFREETVIQEMKDQKVRIDKGTYDIKEEKEEKGRLAREKAEEDQNKLALEGLRKTLLESAFIAIEKTIFENFPEVQSIEYRLDGVQKDLSDLEYKLSVKRTR